MLGALILTSVLGIYQQVRAGGIKILDRMQQTRLQTEILQKIAEDIDRLAAPGFDSKINFLNKMVEGYRSSELVLENSYYGKGDKKEIYERIVWQTAYDSYLDAMILYRMHEGLNFEDPVLLANENEPSYVPVAVGLTHFQVLAQQGQNILGAWTSEELPKAARIEISFAAFQELSNGTVGIPQEEIFSRTVAIDRMRMIPFQFVKKTFDVPEFDDPNELTSDDEAGTKDDASVLQDTESEPEGGGDGS